MTASMLNTQTIGALVIDRDTDYINHGYETASAYDKLLLKAGTYPFHLTAIDHTPWTPGRRSVHSRMPDGPYYAVAHVNAVLVEHYYNSEGSPVGDLVTHSVQLYAYEVGKRRSWGTVGRIAVNKEFRADTYSCLADLTSAQYQEVLKAAVQWLRKAHHGNYYDQPAWHIWNQIETRTLGGLAGFSKAILENRCVGR